MSVDNARNLGRALIEVAATNTSETWKTSNANPGLGAKGNMKLPTIIWSKYGRLVKAAAQARTGLSMKAEGGYVNVDLEFPDDSHIKMKSYEVHIGVQLEAPTGTHDGGEGIPVHVPEEEFQKARQEKNPLSKTRGDFYVQLDSDIAAGLGILLRDLELPSSATGV